MSAAVDTGESDYKELCRLWAVYNAAYWEGVDTGIHTHRGSSASEHWNRFINFASRLVGDHRISVDLVNRVEQPDHPDEVLVGGLWVFKRERP